MESSLLIYMRLIGYNAIALTSRGTGDSNIVPVTDTLDTSNEQFIKVSAYSGDVDQVLNIGSASSGAGAGKILFNPFKITRFSDALSPVLFEDAAAGKAFRTVEVFFINARKLLVVRHTYKLVAIKTVAWSAVSGEAGMVETVSFEYGGLVITVYQHNKTTNVVQAGWNRVKNISDNDIDTVIS